MPSKGGKASPKQIAALKAGREKMCSNQSKSKSQLKSNDSVGLHSNMIARRRARLEELKKVLKK